MAKTEAPPIAETAAVTGVAAKAAAAARRVEGLRSDLRAARSLAQQALVREALTRTELTLALGDALQGRAASEAGRREQSARAYFASTERKPLRQLAGLSLQVRRGLMRLGPWGHARVIARAGVWRGEDFGAMVAYARRRGDPTAQPATLFDQAWYLATYPDARASGLAPLVHYLVAGATAELSPHPLFDAVFYGRANGSDLAGLGVSALEHFIRDGAARGRDPHPLFDLAHYAAQLPEWARGEDPVSHYMRAGWQAGLSPHPLFDAAWYRRQMPRQAAEVAPLVHYLTGGWRDGLTPHPLFDPAWYLEQNADVLAGGSEPLTHFVTAGAPEGRSPSPWFDLPHYVAARGDRLNPGINPLVDYLQGGAWAVSEAKPGFPSAAYLATAPELAREGMTPLEHWARKAAAGRAARA